MMNTKASLIASLITGGYLKTPSIIQAFKKVDRADFVRPEYRDAAYEDHPLPIGFGQTISQPLTVALMLEWLAPLPGDRILDIGCGSGWTTALLASIAGKKGRVIGIERISQLAEFAKSNLAKYPLLQHTRLRPPEADYGGQASSVQIISADASVGYEKEAPFDRILASAAAFGEIPPAWKEQLTIGGRIVAPVEDSLVVIDKVSRDKYQTAKHWGFAFVPLVKD